MHSPPALDSLEAALERAVSRFDDGSPVSEQIRYHFGFGTGERRGKRLRSRLVLEVAAEEGAPADEVLDAACAVEILHEFSLVHDDIEDGDRLRRGRETTWSRFGLAHGINAGDALCAVAYLALLDGTAIRPAETTLTMTRALHEAHLAMCAGQGRDIAFETEARVGMDDYMAMIGGKTAALFGVACELGALAAGAEPERARAYARLGRAYGVAFQIEDDVLGTWGDSATTGKPCGADLAKRKWIFPVVWALAGPPSAERATVAAAYAGGRALDPASVAAVNAALERLGARQAALDAARAALAQAEAVAAGRGIDRSGRVRAFFARAVRRIA
ncbi:MAG: geranylgeranyl diphosphate synthase, type [Candidatus Eremiobacteraeota bacterium]|nr:geranylgeranyl diphosphate synthase, type [Candidatus Eremiobacteraeota bacterium]